MTKPVAHVFKDGDSVIVNATATKPNGDKLPQAGRRGVVTGSPKPGRHMVDVPGMPLVNLPSDELTPVPSVGSPASGVTDVVAKGDTPNTPAPAAQATNAAYAFDVLQLTAIVRSLTNPRTWFDPIKLKDLSDDIAFNGVLQPILVRPLPAARLQETFSDRRKGDPLPGYEIVAGERRFRACLMAGVRSVPVLIRHLTDEQVLRMQLIENVQREDLHPIEEAQGYRRILDLDSQAEKPMAARVDELASGIKKSSRYIYQTLQLLHLADFPKQVFLEGKLQRTTALQIATIGNEAGQIEATRRIAGLGQKGTEVINDPMSQRTAATYVQSNHRLVLSKAPFPVKVALASAPACGECPKMSNNATELFDEGHKGPDTCMDPSCYGKKNVAHGNQLAEAARTKGQRVISGADAKKLIPYSHSARDEMGSYRALDDKCWDVEAKKQGQTVRQLLGKDMPNPVLLADPYKGGFIEVLPKADVARLLKERGLLSKSISDNRDEAKETERKNKIEKAYRWALAEQLLARADNVDDIELFEDLIIPIAVQIYLRLDNECMKRTHKLMGWDFAHFGYRERAKTVKHFKELNAGEMNKFLITACISSELHIAEYYKPGSDSLDAMTALLNVDAKAIKTKMQGEAKAIEKAKADKAKAKATPAAKKTAAPANQATTVFAYGARVRFKQGLKGPAGILRKVCGREGTISSKSGDDYMVRTGEGAGDVHRATVFELELAAPLPVSNKTLWREPTAIDMAAMKPGDRVRVNDDKAQLSAMSNVYAGKVGLLSGKCGPAAWFVEFKQGGAGPRSIHVTELLVPSDPAAGPAAAAKKPTAKKTARTETQLELAVDSDKPLSR